MIITQTGENFSPNISEKKYIIPQKRPYVIPQKRKPLENRTNFIVTAVFEDKHLAVVPKDMLKPEYRYMNKENI
jgi:hypothetical protein